MPSPPYVFHRSISLGTRLTPAFGRRRLQYKSPLIRKPLLHPAVKTGLTSGTGKMDTIHFTTYYLRHYYRTWIFDAFKWETLDDPAHGRINYVDKPTAINAN